MELHLSKDNWRDEIKDNDDLPNEMQALLMNLIQAEQENLIPPMADGYLIKLAKEHLQDAIWIDGRQFCYSIMVFVPENTETGRTFFQLVPRFPWGELKRLSEL